LIAEYLKEQGYTVGISSNHQIAVFYKKVIVAKVYRFRETEHKIGISTGKNIRSYAAPPNLEVDVHDPYSFPKILRHIRNRGYLAFLEDGRNH
jgi:hypothetical protein